MNFREIGRHVGGLFWPTSIMAYATLAQRNQGWCAFLVLELKLSNLLSHRTRSIGRIESKKSRVFVNKGKTGPMRPIWDENGRTPIFGWSRCFIGIDRSNFPLSDRENAYSWTIKEGMASHIKKKIRSIGLGEKQTYYFPRNTVNRS